MSTLPGGLPLLQDPVPVPVSGEISVPDGRQAALPDLDVIDYLK